MTRLLPLLLLCACAGSLLDHGGLLPGGGTPACQATCTTTVPGATALCVGDTCTYECHDGQLKSGTSCNKARALSAGASHTCAVVAGEARCWGANDQGQLGRPGASSFVPVQAVVTGTVTAIAAGSLHTCAIADGDIWCWGDNTFGQLGLGTVGGNTATPQKVPNFSGASTLAAGGSHTCAVSATEMRCWGRNNYGQIGNGASSAEPPRSDPTPVVGIGVPLSVAAGDAHTCAVATSGVFCWGNNEAGQLGINQSGGWHSTPTLINDSTLSGASFLGLGANHSCAGGLSTTLYCWGANGLFQVDSSGQDQKSPRQTSLSARAVVGGTGHTCAIAGDQSLKCWGLNQSGQLGVASAGQDVVDVGLNGVQAVAAGSKHTCAVANGVALCWGLNDRGQLGADPASTTALFTAMPSAVSGR